MSAPVPTYRHHKPSGQAVVTLNGLDLYLGAWNSPASRQECNRLVSEWLANSRQLPTAVPLGELRYTFLLHWRLSQEQEAKASAPPPPGA